MLADAREHLRLGAEERICNERCECAGRDRQLYVLLVAPCSCDLGEEFAPSRHGGAPTGSQAGIREADGPELPQDPDVSGAQVLTKIGARSQPLLGEGLRASEELSLPSEQELILPVEHGSEQLLLAAEVVMDEREANTGA